MELYSAGTVALATGTSLPTLQRYKQQGIVRLQPCDQPSSGSGDRCGYSLRRVIQVALITELNKIGIAPSRAAKAALEFSDRGGHGRAVGELYPLGTTYLVGLPGGESRTVNVPPDLSVADVLANESAAFILNCNKVVERITEKLETISDNT
jgi:hypothetical protein